MWLISLDISLDNKILFEKGLENFIVPPNGITVFMVMGYRRADLIHIGTFV